MLPGLVPTKKGTKIVSIFKKSFITTLKAFDGIRKCGVEQSTHLKCLDISSMEYNAFDGEFQNVYPEIYLCKATNYSTLEKPS